MGLLIVGVRVLLFVCVCMRDWPDVFVRVLVCLRWLCRLCVRVHVRLVLRVRVYV